MRGVVVAVVPSRALAVKRQRPRSVNPPFGQMIVEAIGALQGRNGSSRQAILKYIKAHHTLGEKVVARRLRRTLITATAAGKLIQTRGSGASGSFKLPEKLKAPVKLQTRVSPVKTKKQDEKTRQPKRMTLPVAKVIDSKTLGKGAVRLERSVVIPKKSVGVGSRLRTPAVKSTPKYLNFVA
ncbi:unnamed protein product [Schistocephalus solidus]|uniref:H15 domain-containing protein n=1 Tax=Schistocephalus solidus TaxID=70667 RepID=A0A183SL31_SCHSO|nr:unnamed protein product [Schistocephalus solidus]